MVELARSKIEEIEVEKPKDLPKLTTKQALFVEHYCSNGYNGTQAVRDSQYSCKTDNVARAIASENLTKPAIVAAIQAHMKAKRKDITIDKQYIQERLKSFADGAERDSDAIRSLELLAKMESLIGEKTVNTNIFTGISEKKRSILHES